ncbi:MAG: glutamine synthetase beta-grasp domain-containing protein [Alphaproteobacteria bacterium]
MVEYIWLDGNQHVPQIRSKSRMIPLPKNPKVSDFPKWTFDGSSTKQAEGGNSDCILEPVCVVADSMQNVGDYLLLCEVKDGAGNIHPSNSRAKLRSVLDRGGEKHEVWLGFEQEYTMFKRNIPLGWPEHGFPAPQGPYYCGVGPEQIFGRDLALEHAKACTEAGLMYYGMNAEVMPGQWEFQVGYRGSEEENADSLTIADHTWIARWLLHRISEKYGIHISLDNKPIKGDWNGAGMHTNFSTKDMRDPKKGEDTIKSAIERLEQKHKEHISVYGYKLEERLTGMHETSSISQFSSGGANRGSSIRIPALVAEKGYGYIEDRRPGANADPYIIAARLIATICDIEIRI